GVRDTLACLPKIIVVIRLREKSYFLRCRIPERYHAAIHRSTPAFIYPGSSSDSICVKSISSVHIPSSVARTPTVCVLEFWFYHWIVKSHVAVEFYAYSFGASSIFGSDHDDSICRTRAVECRCCSTFQDGHFLDIVWAYFREAISILSA